MAIDWTESAAAPVLLKGRAIERTGVHADGEVERYDVVATRNRGRAQRLARPARHCPNTRSLRRNHHRSRVDLCVWHAPSWAPGPDGGRIDRRGNRDTRAALRLAVGIRMLRLGDPSSPPSLTGLYTGSWHLERPVHACVCPLITPRARTSPRHLVDVG
jgi:hypothetical protein